jgi:putative tryptophan/tyrosine transport system substrate-binding protein
MQIEEGRERCSTLPSDLGREFPEAGGLISYACNRMEDYRQLGVYAAKILNGTKPTDLPVMQPGKLELVINLKTAKALGLDLPDRSLALADEVIG